MEQRFAIFDMDGTLVDSMLYWHNLGQEYLESKGVTGDLNEVLERSKPMTMVESGALFIREFGLAGTPESVAAEINAVMEGHYRNDVQLKEGGRLADLAPTMLSVLGLEKPAAMSGENLILSK